jgi:hypothetical protein
MKIPRALLVLIRRRVLNHMSKYPPTRVITNLAGAPYLNRWELRGNHPTFDVYLHQFLKSDDNQALHDHTASSIAIVVRGRYTEWLRANRPRIRNEGDIVARRATMAHRIEIDEARPGPITVFIRGPKSREWGFYCARGWRHHHNFSVSDSESNRVPHSQPVTLVRCSEKET